MGRLRQSVAVLSILFLLAGYALPFVSTGTPMNCCCGPETTTCCSMSAVSCQVEMTDCDPLPPLMIPTAVLLKVSVDAPQLSDLPAWVEIVPQHSIDRIHPIVMAMDNGPPPLLKLPLLI